MAVLLFQPPTTNESGLSPVRSLRAWCKKMPDAIQLDGLCPARFLWHNPFFLERRPKQIREKDDNDLKNSPAGNRTRVVRVTGGSAADYTTGEVRWSELVNVVCVVATAGPLFAANGGLGEMELGQGVVAADEQEVVYTCRKCGTLICRGDQITPHAPGKGQDSFSYKKRNAGQTSFDCTSLFVEEYGRPSWMGTTLPMEEVEGKITCPKCKGRVGSYNWSGAQCSCGYWTTPSIQVLKSRVDEKHRPRGTS
ncbi:dual specificity phosphatase 12 [Balamuthia mandrillaris]